VALAQLCVAVDAVQRVHAPLQHTAHHHLHDCLAHFLPSFMSQQTLEPSPPPPNFPSPHLIPPPPHNPRLCGLNTP
jgi:hypothetical protein